MPSRCLEQVDLVGRGRCSTAGRSCWPDWLNVALKYTAHCCRLAAPAVSEYCSAKRLARSRARTRRHRNRRWHAGSRRHGPGAQLLPSAVGPRYIRGVQVDVLGSGIGWFEGHRQIQRQRVAARTTVVAATLTEHWLFCNVVAAPGVAASHAVAASLSKFNWLVAGCSTRSTELAALVNALLNQAYTYSRLAAPAVSEYCNAKLWLAPDPELGDTPAATGADCSVAPEFGSTISVVASTASKFDPVMVVKTCRSSLFQRESGAPEMYHDDPLSASIMP